MYIRMSLYLLLLFFFLAFFIFRIFSYQILLLLLLLLLLRSWNKLAVYLLTYHELLAIRSVGISSTKARSPIIHFPARGSRNNMVNNKGMLSQS